MPSVETCWIHGAHIQTTMAMVHHKKESISNGVSRESSTSEENKHKKTNTLANGCKCCVKF